MTGDLLSAAEGLRQDNPACLMELQMYIFLYLITGYALYTRIVFNDPKASDKYLVTIFWPVVVVGLAVKILSSRRRI